MARKILACLPVGLACAVIWMAVPVQADEGMWLFESLPRQQLEEQHSAELAVPWLEHLQKSCVRIGSGGSGAFVSADGLILTNHHVGLRWFSHLVGHDPRLVQDGFYGRNRVSEIKCPGLVVSVPWETEDVTRRVHDAIKPGMSLAAAHRARAAVLRALEKESRDKTGLTSEVEAIYHGGKYRLVRYQEGTSGNHAVCASGLVAILKTVYDAGELVKELGAPAPKTIVARSTPSAPKPGTAGSNVAEARYQPAAGTQSITRLHKNLLPALLKALKDPDVEVVRVVTGTLGNLGVEAVPALTPLLQSPDHILRARAAAALGKTGPAGQQAMPALLRALQDKEVDVRREAARAIGLIVRSPQLVVPHGSGSPQAMPSPGKREGGTEGQHPGR